MNEKIFKYAEGEMTPEERENFERELGKSEFLKAELETYRNFLGGVNRLKDVETDAGYFINLIPEFRKNLDIRKKKKYHPAFSFAGAVATVMILFFILPVNNIRNVNDYAGTFSSAEISDYLANYDDQQVNNTIPENYPDNYDNLVEGMLYDQLRTELSTSATASVYNNVDYNSLVETINQEEADHIYATMINKKIF